MNTIEKLLLVGVASCFILMLMIYRLPDGLLHSWFLNIGQGDAALIRGPMGELVLIDGGPDSKVMERMGVAIMPYEREIELVVVSHPHADHLNGLLDVFKAYQVKNLLITGVKYEYAGYRELMKMAEKNGTKIWYADGSFDFKIGRIGLDLIYPMTSMRGRLIENVNNSSIVMRVIYGDRKLLFSGDLEEEKEREIAAEKFELSADVLKAGHHGSKTSSTAEFLGRVNPDVAVISCGIDNKFKHPFPGTLERMSGKGITIYRTDLDGTVEMTTDGEEMTWKSNIGK